MFIKNFFFVVINTISLFQFIVVSERYSFSLFENFEVTKSIFTKEQSVVQSLRLNLRTLNSKLDGLRRSIMSYSNGFFHNDAQNGDIVTNHIHFQRKVVIGNVCGQNVFPNDFISSTWSILFKDANYTFDYTTAYRVPIIEIMKSSLKGLVMIQDTYHQDIKKFSSGDLNIEIRSQRASRKTDSLNANDLAAMSSTAFWSYNWYDSSIRYLKESLESLPIMYNETQHTGAVELRKVILEMKTQYISYHNELYHEKPNIFGKWWKLYPYMVDSG